MFPDLFAPNPASHLIWWVAGALFLVLVVMLLVELLDGVRTWMRARRAASEDDLPFPPHPEDLFLVREPDTELRRRAPKRIEPYRRTWHEGRPNEPTEQGR